MMIFSYSFLLLFLFYSPYLMTCFKRENERDYQTNLILIMFDDLRPLLSAYGEKHMITPNLDRLASKSIIFDNANCQVAVCNPSRNSMMTGLRPDTIASYAFSNSWQPYLSFPQHLQSVGYNIANYGKIYHWDDFDDRLQIGYGMGASDWYGYQGSEYGNLNSTVNPDRHTPEEKFRDYIYTSKMIEGLKKVSSLPDYFFLGIGYKLPHIHLHYPWKYYDMYRSRASIWNEVTSKHLHYPRTAPAVSYRCCAYGEYIYMNDEGNRKSHEQIQTNSNLTRTFPHRMYMELIWS
jgi:iduronate 2-sulfatase